jgi:hypothetical protein
MSHQQNWHPKLPDPPRKPKPHELDDDQLETELRHNPYDAPLVQERQKRQLSGLNKLTEQVFQTQKDLKESVDHLAKPHWIVRWTLLVAILTLFVCVIGYWTEIARFFRALRF